MWPISLPNTIISLKKTYHFFKYPNLPVVLFQTAFYAESNPIVLAHCTAAISSDRLTCVWTFAVGSVDAA